MIFRNLEISKIFAEVQQAYVKLDGKHDGDVSKPVGPTDHELYRNFLLKCGKELLKMEPPKFLGRIRNRRRRKPM